MTDTPRARPGSFGGWDRARRAYLEMLGADDPARSLLAAGALDLRLGYEADAVDPNRLTLRSGPQDLVELRAIVEESTGVGTWPIGNAVTGDSIVARVGLARPATLLALLMAMEPDIYMFDEPTAGMSLDQAPAVLDLIAQIKSDPTKTVLLVEHKMDVVRALADRIIVLHNGELLADGPPDEVMSSQIVRDVYLGTATEETA